MTEVTCEYFQLVSNHPQVVCFSCCTSPTRKLSSKFLEALSVTSVFCKLGHELYRIAISTCFENSIDSDSDTDTNPYSHMAACISHQMSYLLLGIYIYIYVILKIKDLKTTNRDRKKSKETRCEMVFN